VVFTRCVDGLWITTGRSVGRKRRDGEKDAVRWSRARASVGRGRARRVNDHDGDVDDERARDGDGDDDDDVVGRAARWSEGRDGTNLERATWTRRAREAVGDRGERGGRRVGDERGTTGDARGESDGDDAGDDETEIETETETETGARRRAGGVRGTDSRERERAGSDARATGCKRYGELCRVLVRGDGGEFSIVDSGGSRAGEDNRRD